MVNHVLKAILLLSPICFTKGIGLDYFNLLFFHLSILSLFIASLFDNQKRTGELHFFGAFLSFLIIHLFWHDFNPTILSEVMNIFFATIGIRIIIVYASISDDLKKYMVTAGLINIFVLSLQYAGYSPIIEVPQNGEPGGIMAAGPRLATYLAITFPFAFGVHWIIGLIYVITGIVLGEISILFVAIMVIVFKLKRIVGWKYIIFFGTIFLIYPAFNSWLCVFTDHIVQSLNIRWAIWEPTINQILSRPMAGFGIGIFSQVSDQFIKILAYHDGTLRHANTAFSSLLQFIFALGIPVSLFFILWFMKDLINKIKFNEETLAILAIIILSVVEYPFQIPRLWPTMMSIIGFYVITKRRDQNVKRDH